MSFAAPEPIIKNTSSVCVKCGIHVKNTRSESWKVGKCPSCWYRDDLYKENTINNSNPLLTVVKPAFTNPFTAYLNKYTISEMENVK